MAPGDPRDNLPRLAGRGRLGAQPTQDGGTCFRVWAPRAARVDVRILPDGPTVELEDEGEGYHSATVAGVTAGARYRYRLDGQAELADPCSRSQPEGVHGPSEVVDLAGFRWNDAGFAPPPWHRWVVYELHVGTFTELGTLDAAAERLDRLVELGVTAVEVMPFAQFPGRRNWGYDGVFLSAVQDSYGGPAAMQRFVDACHRNGLAVVADVVYNHFGPEGNVLESYGPYVTDRYATPWGSAVNVEHARSDEVRRFLLENALQWFVDFHVDALRLDAVHWIIDASPYPFLTELADVVAAVSAELGRRLHLVAESADNNPRLIAAREVGGHGLDAQWCDDFHHSLHCLLTGEQDGYYADFGSPEQLARAMAEGYAFQGEYSAFRHRRHGAPPPERGGQRFVAFTQNHDQVGNRPGGDRLSALVDVPRLRLAAASLLLAPSVPMLFMGEEYGEAAPFPYFVDHGDPALLEAVRAGRAAEFGTEGDQLDPAAESTFAAAKLHPGLGKEPGHAGLLSLYRGLLAVRERFGLLSDPLARSDAHSEGALVVLSRSREGARALVLLNTGTDPATYRLPGDVDWTTVVDAGSPELGGSGAVMPSHRPAGESIELPAFGFAMLISEDHARRPRKEPPR